MPGHGHHRPVLLQEVMTGLQVRPDGKYVDGTFGRGGHSRAILAQLGPAGQLLAVDKDPQAVQVAKETLGTDKRFEIEQGSFAMLAQMVEARGWTGKVDGILLDLGVSSPQLDDASRGFSFRQDGPLDMRMDPDSGISAAQWLAQGEEQEIADVLKEYGEERHARRIAHAIVREREHSPITTTRQLAALIARASPSRERHKDPATRSFQAIRIYINRELEDLDQILMHCLELLAPGGRLAVISFHSLEDRRVKRFIQQQVRGDDFPPEVPVTHDMLNVRMRSVNKAIRAGKQEIAENPRARSAVLRIAERLH